MGKVICRKRWQGLIAIFLALTLILADPGKVRADTTSVTLSSFEATGLLGEVDLIWTTATELNNSGFFVNRSTSLTGTRQRVPVIIPGVDNPQLFVPSTSDGLSDTTYEVYDRNVNDGATYTYWVESISTSGTSSFSSPQSATTLIDATLSQTPSATITFTPTPSSTTTATSITTTGTTTATATPTLTRAPTLTPSFTPYFFSATTQPAPSSTWTPSVSTTVTGVLTTTATLTNTATLVPLPSLTLLFPLVTDTGTPTPTQTGIPRGAFSSLTNRPGGDGLSLGVKLLIVLIVLIWALLGAFLFLYIRRIGTGA